MAAKDRSRDKALVRRVLRSSPSAHRYRALDALERLVSPEPLDPDHFSSYAEYDKAVRRGR